MPLRKFDVSMDLEHKEYEPLIINGESKPFIKFCVHPVSEYRKIWFTESSEDTKNILVILHGILRPITGNNPVQIEMDTLSTISSDTFTDFLCSIPEITWEKRDELADDLISRCRKLFDGSKSVEVSVEISASTLIYLNEKDMQVVAEFERHHSGAIPASRWSVAALKRLGSCRPNDDVCPICLEEELEGWDVVRMPCWHEFHAKCVVNWLKNRRDCPMCRYMMPSRIFEELFDDWS